MTTVAVIGAGAAGRAFALRCAGAGFAVVLEDVMPSNLRRAQDEYGELAGVEASGSLRVALTVEDAVRDADLAIDFVPDELESKLEIFSLLDRMAPPRTILCTPTNALSITDLASCTYRSGLCVALRGELFAGPGRGGAQLVRGGCGAGVRGRDAGADGCGVERGGRQRRADAGEEHRTPLVMNLKQSL
jgi:hypothetical protein